MVSAEILIVCGKIFPEELSGRSPDTTRLFHW